MRPVALFFLCGLAGCQSVPHVSAPLEVVQTPLIRLCQHDVPAEETAIKEELLRYAAPGTSLELAWQRLEAMEFRPFGCVPKKYHRLTGNLREALTGFDEKARRNANRLIVDATCDEIGAWGQRYFPVRAVLYFDENMNVTEVEVPRLPTKGRRTDFAWYFSRRPNLHEPLGMPVEQARTLLEAEGFRCQPVALDKHEKSGRPYLACRAVAETPLGGSIIRVRLFPDETGKVIDSYVRKDGDAFDEWLCMLPDQDDTIAHALLKTILFAPRLYASIVVGGLEADLAMGRP